MKNKSLLPLALAALGAAPFAPVCHGQTNAPPVSPEQTFVQSLGGYLTTINYTNTFTNCVLEASTGVSQDDAILADYVKVQYDFGPRSAASGPRWDVSATVRNAGIGGVIQSAELGAGWKAIAAGDTALTVALEGGWDWTKNAGVLDPQLYLRKKATKNTFFETGLNLPEWTVGKANKTPGFFIGTGFTY